MMSLNSFKKKIKQALSQDRTSNSPTAAPATGETTRPLTRSQTKISCPGTKPKFRRSDDKDLESNEILTQKVMKSVKERSPSQVTVERCRNRPLPPSKSKPYINPVFKKCKVGEKLTYYDLHNKKPPTESVSKAVAVEVQELLDEDDDGEDWFHMDPGDRPLKSKFFCSPATSSEELPLFRNEDAFQQSLDDVYEAIEKSDMDILTSLVPSVVSPCTTENAYSLLHYASMTNQVRPADYLLSIGANIEAKNDLGASPLYVAASEACVDMVRLLLDRKANPGHCDNEGWTPLHIAAISEGASRVIEMLLNCGADGDAYNAYGVTPLHAAACLGIEENIITLIRSHKCTVSKKNSKGADVLSYTKVSGVVRREIEEMMLTGWDEAVLVKSATKRKNPFSDGLSEPKRSSSDSHEKSLDSKPLTTFPPCNVLSLVRSDIVPLISDLGSQFLILLNDYKNTFLSLKSRSFFRPCNLLVSIRKVDINGITATFVATESLVDEICRRLDCLRRDGNLTTTCGKIILGPESPCFFLFVFSFVGR